MLATATPQAVPRQAKIQDTRVTTATAPRLRNVWSASAGHRRTVTAASRRPQDQRRHQPRLGFSGGAVMMGTTGAGGDSAGAARESTGGGGVGSRGAASTVAADIGSTSERADSDGASGASMGSSVFAATGSGSAVGDSSRGSPAVSSRSPSPFSRRRRRPPRRPRRRRRSPFSSSPRSSPPATLSDGSPAASLASSVSAPFGPCPASEPADS